MMDSLRNSSIGDKFTLVVIALFAVAMIAGVAVVGATAVDSLTSEPVGDENTTTTTDIAWLDATMSGNNTATVTAYNETGTVIWESEIRDFDLNSDTNPKIGIASNSNYVYVSSAFEAYKLNTTTGEHIETIDAGHSYTIALSPSGNLLGFDHRRQSLSKDRFYNISENGTITVNDISYDGTGNYSVVQRADYSSSSYENENIASESSPTIHTATDNHVVVQVPIDNRSEDIYDIHIVNSSTGASVYEIEHAVVQDATVTPNGTIVFDARIEGESSTQGNINETYVEFDSQNETVLTEYTENAGDIDHDFFRTSWADDLTYTPIGEYDISIEKASLYEYDESYQISIYNDSGDKIYENDSGKFGENHIDAYGGAYDIEVDGLGLQQQRVNDTTIYHSRTNTQTFSMEYAGTGVLNITSVTDNDSTELENWSVQVYDSNGETVTSAENATAPKEFELTAQESYTVEVSKSGYVTEQKSVSISENNTTEIAYTLSEESTEEATTEDDGVEAIIPGGGSSGGATSLLAVVFGVGGIGFLIFLLFAALAFRQFRRQSFAIILGILVLSMTVAPTMFVGDATAQTESTPPDEVADLLVFTAFEDKQGQPIKNSVYAVDPSTNETAWVTKLDASGTGNESAITVASDETANRIYALTIGDNNTVRTYSLDSATGTVLESHKLNLTTTKLGREAVADDSTLYFNTPDKTYSFNIESDSLTEIYTYEMTPVQAYSMGIQDGQLQQAAYNSDLNTTFIYEGDNRTDDFSASISRLEYTSQGYVYQTTGDSYLKFRTNGTTTWSFVESDAQLRAAASDGTDVYATVGDELRLYGTDANTDETLLYKANPSNETTHRLSTLDYNSGYLHQFQTRQGTNLSSDTPTLVYRMHDPSTGDLVYETKIAHNSNYHRSVAVVHDADTISAIVGGGGTNYTLQDLLSDFLPTEYILAGLGILLVAFVGILLLIWRLAKMPIRVILAPVRFVMWLLKLLIP